MHAKKLRKMETNVTFDGDVAAIVVKPFSIEKHNRGLSRRSLFAVNAFSPQEECVCLRQASRIFFTDVLVSRPQRRNQRSGGDGEEAATVS